MTPTGTLNCSGFLKHLYALFVADVAVDESACPELPKVHSPEPDVINCHPASVIGIPFVYLHS